MGNIYSGIKILHYKEKIDSLPHEENDLLPPIHVRVKPTNKCNHRCKYCAYRADGLQLGQDMDPFDSIPENKMMELIDDFIKMDVKAVTFSGGGEPFSYPYLKKAAIRLTESEIKFASLTNGALVSGELAEIFAHNATWLRVSMDGWDSKSYAEYRNVSTNEFGKVLTNMTSFKAFGGKCYLGINYIVDNKNCAHIEEFASKIIDTGVDSIKFSPCIISNDGAANNTYHAAFFLDAKARIEKVKNSCRNSGVEIFDAYHELDNDFSKNYQWCPYQQILPVVGADCNVYTCQDKAYNKENGLIGSFKNQSFSEFWYSDKNKFFQTNPSVHCRNHCVADAKNRLILDYLNVNKDHCAFV